VGEPEIAAAENRERTYKFYAALCLKPPSDQMIGMIRDRSILPLFEGGDVDETGVKWLSEFVTQAERIPNLKEELEAEYTALFVLPSGALPHESVYLDKEMRLGGSVTAGVRQYYEKAGATILESCTEMPDHIGFELEFMGFLCSMEKQLWKMPDRPLLNKCVALQKMFVEEHLSKWAYACCQDVIKRATYGFYRAVLYFIAEFLHCEEEYIADLSAGIDER